VDIGFAVTAAMGRSDPAPSPTGSASGGGADILAPFGIDVEGLDTALDHGLLEHHF